MFRQISLAAIFVILSTITPAALRWLLGSYLYMADFPPIRVAMFVASPWRLLVN
jgi:hypothetical protein